MDKRLKSSETSRIEQLPDDVLLHILSSLTVADVVRTSILSRRWRNLWRYNTCLDFDATTLLPMDLIDTSCSWYIAWVNKFIDARVAMPGLPSVKEFRIRYRLEKRNTHHIDRWINFAIANRVEVLHLELCGYKGMVIPEHQHNLSEESWFKAPAGLSSLQCLKSLFLSCVNVSKQFIEFVLSSCPLLEDLSLHSAGTFTDLDVSGVPPLRLRQLNIVADDCCVLTKLCAPHLISFSHESLEFKPQKIDVPMLTDLTIGSEVGSSHIMEYLEHFWSYLPQLKKLDLIMKEPRNFKLKGTGELVNLKYLKMHFTGDTDPILHRIVNFMSACPLLETLAIQIFDLHDETETESSSPFSRHQRSWKMKKNWHKAKKISSFKCLKVLELCGAHGEIIDQEVVKFIIDKSPNLEKLTVNTRLPFWHPSFLSSDRRVVEIVKEKAKDLCQGSSLEIEITVVG